MRGWSLFPQASVWVLLLCLGLQSLPKTTAALIDTVCAAGNAAFCQADTVNSSRSLCSEVWVSVPEEVDDWTAALPAGFVRGLFAAFEGESTFGDPLYDASVNWTGNGKPCAQSPLWEHRTY